MNTTTLLPLEKKDDVDDVESSYQKTNKIAIITKNNKNENENKSIKKMVLIGGIFAMSVGGAIGLVYCVSFDKHFIHKK